jgi:radical SAM superfamily enzyme YgiQ (UPF0313 family)
MWKIIEKHRCLLKDESGFVIKDWGGKTPVALVYPNTYYVGMSNLAVHTLYKLLNDDERIVCERAFLPETKDLREHKRTNSSVISIENQRPLSEFSCVAFSISFQNDFLNVIPILSLCSIPHRREQRNDSHPLLIAGGCAVTMNPMALSEIFDCFVIGETEELINEIIPILSGGAQKKDTLDELAKIDGIFVPSISKSKTKRRFVKDINKYATQTVIHTPHTEFSGMHLVEMSRGCPRRCSFCATPCLYDPYRTRDFDSIMQMIETGIGHKKRFGLIGADLLIHPAFIKTAEAIHQLGAAFSPASVRVDEINSENAKLLAQSGHKSVSLGVEAANERLRSSIGKTISNERIFKAIESLAGAGICSLRLYFMIGLPGETADDINAIGKMAIETLKILRAEAPRKKRTSSVSLTISPFVPKPLTAFERMPFAGEKYLKDAIRKIKGTLGRTEGISVNVDSIASSMTDAILSRGDHRLISFLEKYAETNSIRKALSELSADDGRHLEKGFSEDEILPWNEF